MLRHRYTLVAFVVMLLTCAPALGGVVNADAPFKATGVVVGSPVAPGGTATAKITIHVLDEHYIYHADTSVEVVEAAGLTVGDPAFPEPKVKFDKWEDKDVAIFNKTIDVPVALQVPAGMAAGTYVVKMDVRYRGCNPKMCFFPSSDSLEFSVQVAAGDAAAQEPIEAATSEPEAVTEAPSEETTTKPAQDATDSPTTVAPPVDTAEESSPADSAAAPAASSSQTGIQQKLGDAMQSAAGKSFILVLLIAFLGGLASSLTPCVYPMIPITIAVIGARGAGNKAKAFSLSLVYVLGIATLYSSLGVIAAATGGVLGGVFSNPIVVIALVLLFIVLALGMFGVYNFALPSSVNTKLSQAGGSGYLGVFIIGLAAGVVASPCTGPVVGYALIMIASGDLSIFQGFLVMFVYSMGLGVLFLVIGTFAASIPQAGAWMSHVKNSFGLMMFLAAFYFLGTLTFVPDAVVGLGMAVVLVVWGVVLGVFTPQAPEAGWGAWILRSFAVLLIMAAFILALRTVGLPGGGHTAAAPVATVEWSHDMDAAFAEAKETGKPLMLDFTAENCAQCRELEHKTFPDPTVIELSHSFVPLAVDCTDINDAEQVLIAKYGVPGMPRIVFTHPDGTEIKGASFQGFVAPDSFTASMRQALDEAAK